MVSLLAAGCGDSGKSTQPLPTADTRPKLAFHVSVDGQPHDGTTFTVHVECRPSAGAGLPTLDQEYAFVWHVTATNGSHVAPPTGYVESVAPGDLCNVAQTADGGASAVKYACNPGADTDPGNCMPSNQDVQFRNRPNELVNIVIFNTFPQ
jgi:hypothetical protein